MSKNPTIYTGACLCRQVQYRITLPVGTPTPQIVLCHCTHCKRYTASPFSTSIVVPRECWEITKGTPKVYIDDNDFGTDLRRTFCGNCGSPLISEPHKLPDKIVVKYGSLDDRTAFTKVEAEIYCKRREVWLEDDIFTTKNVPKFEAMHID